MTFRRIWSCRPMTAPSDRGRRCGHRRHRYDEESGHRYLAAVEDRILFVDQHQSGCRGRLAWQPAGFVSGPRRDRNSLDDCAHPAVDASRVRITFSQRRTGKARLVRTSRPTTRESSGVIRIGPDLIVSTVDGSSHCRSWRRDQRLGHDEEPGRRQCGAFDDALLFVRRIRPRRRLTSCSGPEPFRSSANGASASVTTSLTLPTTTATGTYYVLALADAPNTVTNRWKRTTRGPARPSKSEPICW